MSEETGSQGSYPKPAVAWYMVILLLIIYTISFIDRQILGLLARPIIQEFEISLTQFGLLTGFAFAIFYATFGLVCARIADSRSRRGLIAFGLFFWSLMTAATATARQRMPAAICGLDSTRRNSTTGRPPLAWNRGKAHTWV